MVIPPSTVAIQTPAVVVDKNAEAHCVEDVANAFVEFLHTPDAQAIYQTRSGTSDRSTSRRRRPARAESTFEPITDLFTTDDIGGWDTAAERHGVRPGRRVHAGAAGGAGIER